MVRTFVTRILGAVDGTGTGAAGDSGTGPEAREASTVPEARKARTADGSERAA